MRTTFRLLMLIALIGLPAAPALPEVEFIDTHIHMFRTSTDPCSYDDAISQALETMDAFGVQMSLVMPTPHEEQGDACDDHTGLALVAGDSSGRFAFLGGGGTLNPLIQDAVNGVAVDEDEFSAVANDILASGAIGFGELVAEHFSLHANHPYMSAPPDHPLFLRLADIAAANNVPIDLHMEAVPCVETRDGVCGIPRPTDLSDVNPEFIPENISALERLLAHNPNARIIWVHAGWDNTGYRTVDLMRRLLNSYPNLYMNIKMSGGSTTERPNLNRPLDDDLQLKPEWLDLISDFPDRFTIGTDVKHLTDELDRIKGDLKRARTFLNLLPEDLAQKVGIINPTCIYALAPCIRFSAAQYGVGENGGSVEITVERVGYTGSEVSVDYTVNDGTATVGVDYNVAALTGTLTFASGETTKTITISIVNDSEVEDNETINLNLTNRTGDGFLWWPLTAVLTIANDDVSFRFKDLFYTVREGKPSGTTTIRVEKLGGTPETVTVNYATSDGTATAGADYGTTTGTLTFSPGDPGVKEFTVPILNDTIPESHETVNLSLSNPINPGGSASLATPNTAVLTILNDDVTFRFTSASYSVSESAGTASITVERLGEAENAVSVDFATSDGTAIGDFQPDYVPTSGTLTFSPGEFTKSFTISIVNDSLVEGNETVNLSLSNATNSNGTAALDSPNTALLTILDEDVAFQFSSASYSVSESAATATIEVQRLGDMSGTVSVNFATILGTATVGVDFVGTSGTLAFGPGETTRAFGVGIISDTIPEPHETVNLALSNPQNPSGGATLGTPSAAVLRILNDDVAFRFSSATYSVSESGGQATITVRRMGALPPGVSVSVEYATVGGGTATAGTDYVATTGRLTFSPGQTTQSFDVTILDDLGPESHETVNMLLRDPVNPVGHAALATPDTAVLTILNDDVVFHFSQGAYVVREGDGIATIEVTRIGDTANDVSVDYATSDDTATAGSDYVPTSGTLTFTASDTTKSFEVTILNDGDREGNETAALALSNPSNPGGNARLGGPSTAMLMIIDDDPAVLGGGL